MQGGLQMQGPQCIGFGSRVVSIMLFQKYVGTLGLKMVNKGIADCGCWTVQHVHFP